MIDDSGNHRDDVIMDAGNFWWKAIANPTLRRFGVSGHAAIFVLLSIVSVMVPVSAGIAGELHVARIKLCLMSTGMAVFALIVSATMAHEIVESQIAQPAGFGTLTIAQATGTAMVHALAAAIIFGCDRAVTVSC